ncbi:phenylalanine--tRNA ligase subunit beta [Lentilitoribacter sp. EG35]|uniref:phenylalanine--tRNA ligase subunit beta n=1 Tax=Lentilitoribacter sp. EG35 TaxID=3234192 RepID=UPI003460DB72
MKFTLSWLKDHIETDASLEEICDQLTMIGLELESLDDKASLKPFVVAKILSAEQHPDADRLRVLSVDNGSGTPVQVVCGAPNAKAGLVGAFAAPGTYVPGIDVTLSVGNIRGVESHGMMCSEKELLISDSHDGIIEISEDVAIGTPYAEWAGLADPVIEINLTPNRPDCTGVSGIARDLAASGFGVLKTPKTPEISGNDACSVSIKIDDSVFCPGFALRMVKDVKNGPSPSWVQQRLLAIGLRPINALVDITNYITFDRGRPLHVFDADKVAGNLHVRAAKKGEKLLGLDGKEYELNEKVNVISDDNGPESLAGIMGGEQSGCDENTTNVLIESALWDPMMIARTGRDLGIITDARYRFERGVDPDFMIDGAEIATQMVLDLCGGTPSKLSVTGYQPHQAKIVEFPYSEVKRLTGLDVSKEESADILTRLGFEIDGTGDVVPVKVPSWRPDVDGKADLVEEVMRIHGVNEIEPQPLPSLDAVNGRILTTLQIRTRSARRALAVRGMSEAVTYSFISAVEAEAFGGGDNSLKLSNPIAADMSDLRPSILPGLLKASQRNADRGFNDVAIFEVSGTYEGDKPEQQRRCASGIRRGTAKLTSTARHWSGNSDAVNVYDAKADALAALEAAGAPVKNLQVEAGGPDWYHPGRSGTIKLGPKTVLGTFGEFHPNVLKKLDVSGALCGFEVFLDAIPSGKRKPTRTKGALTLSPYQAVRRDFAFVVDKDVQAAAIIRAAAGADKKLVTAVNVFDVFEGPSLGTDKKSIAIEVTIQPFERTMTEEDFEALSQKIIGNVSKSTGGALRG